MAQSGGIHWGEKSESYLRLAEGKKKNGASVQSSKNPELSGYNKNAASTV